MKTLIPFLTLIFLTTCHDKPKPENNPPSPNPFTGVYVNTRTGTDTIDFDSFKDSPTFYFRRSMDTTATRPGPKRGLGFYRFVVSDNKIRLDWSFASKSDTTGYVFQMKGDSLMIGNFYEKERKGEVEVFVRNHEGIER